jgi:hypothetical protein
MRLTGAILREISCVGIYSSDEIQACGQGQKTYTCVEILYFYNTTKNNVADLQRAIFREKKSITMVTKSQVIKNSFHQSMIEISLQQYT